MACHAVVSMDVYKEEGCESRPTALFQKSIFKIVSAVRLFCIYEVFRLQRPESGWIGVRASYRNVIRTGLALRMRIKKAANLSSQPFVSSKFMSDLYLSSYNLATSSGIVTYASYIPARAFDNVNFTLPFLSV